jgi:tRNA threonylcarbamoyladenosine modification (KEOPS) complex Cgi121 subunit
VININAQTDKGQQHVSSAIQQAINSGFNNTNVNVSMNIRNSGQAGMADIHKMLATAFS